MKTIKKIGVSSFARFQGILGAIIGLICGILYSFGGLIIDVLVSSGWISLSDIPGLSYGTILAFGALVGMPIVFALAGYLLGIIEAIFYNLYARWFGGINIDLEF